MLAILLTCLVQPPASAGSEINVTNTAELIAAANNDAPNQTIRLSAGTYELPKQLPLKSGTRLIGSGIDKTIITHTNGWQASPKALPDPETRLNGFDMGSYLIRLVDKADSVEIANLTLRGPQVHGAILGVSPTKFHLHHVKIHDVMWSGLRTFNMQFAKVHDCEFVDAGGKWKKGGIAPVERGGICGGAMFLTWVKDSEIAHNRFRRTNTTKARAHFGIKGRQGKRCRIHHNTIGFGFSIEFPFEGDEDMEIDHNVLRGAVSIPKHAGGKVPKSGRTFHIHHNYFTTSYAIEFVRNGVEVDHNLFDFDVNKDGGNLISGFGKVAAPGPAKFHNNLVSNPGRGVIWINEPYDNFDIRNNHIITRTTATPRKEGLFSFRSKTNFENLVIRDNIVECIGQPRRLVRNDAMYSAKVTNNKLTNVADADRFSNADETVGLEEPLHFTCGVHDEFRVDGWTGKPVRETTTSKNEAWQPLFNGKDLSNWRRFLARPDKAIDVPDWKRNEDGEYPRPLGLDNDPLDVYTVVECDGRPAIRISGQVIGNLFTKKQFRNYHLRAQFKWGKIKWDWMKGRPRDGGILYHYNRSKGGQSWRHEYQIHEGDVGSWWAKHVRVSIPAEWTTDIPKSIRTATPFLIEHVPTLGDKMLMHKPQTPLHRFEGKPEWQICIANPYNEKPAGEWNTLEIVCFENHALHRINGTECLALLNASVLVDGTERPVDRGSIQLQSEGAELFFRDVEIRLLKETPPEIARVLQQQ